MKRKQFTGHLLFLLCWSGLIFWFSAQNAQVSSGQSGRVVNVLIRVFVRDFNVLEADRQEKLLELMSFIVRKGAHFTEYMVFGIAAANMFRAAIPSKRAFLFAWLLGTVYAGTDEIHQFFSDGRAPMFRDVLLDSAGVFTGILICGLLVFLLRRKKETVSKTERKKEG